MGDLYIVFFVDLCFFFWGGGYRVLWGYIGIYLHKLLREPPRQTGRQVNINEVSDEVNNQDLRYQRGNVINVNICGQRLNMDSPFKPLARECVNTHADVKKNAQEKQMFLILSPQRHSIQSSVAR